MPCSPGRSISRTWASLCLVQQPRCRQHSRARFAFPAVGLLAVRSPGGLSLEEPSAQMLGLLGDAVAAPALGLSPGEGSRCRAAGAHSPVPCSLPQEVRAWQGENSLLQRALEETAQGGEEEEEEDKMKKSQVKHHGPGWQHVQPLK